MVGVRPIINMDAIFFLLRVPIFLIGIALSIIALPVDLLILIIIELFGRHLLIIILRILGMPFVIIGSAWFDRSWWPDYLKGWEKAHDSVKPDWGRPFRRFPEIMTWLIEGPKGDSKTD